MVAALIAGVAFFVLLILLKKPKLPTGSGSPNYLQAVDSLSVEEQETLTFQEHLNQGNALVSQCKYHEALHHFKEALRLKSDEPSVHFKIGRIFLQMDNIDYAVKAFRISLSLNSNQVEAYYELARAYQQIPDVQQAHQALDQALQLVPTHEESLKLKIKLLEQAQEHRQALPLLQKLIETSRSPLKYRDLLADFHLKLGHLQEVITELQSLITLDPANQARYLGKIGQAYFDQGQYSTAIEAFKQVIQETNINQDPAYFSIIKSQLAAALCNEGVKRYELGDFNGAIEHYREALLYDDANADIHYNLGKALIQIQETTQAIRHFEAAIRLSPEDASCYYELAVLQDEKGMISEALSNYQKVLRLEPGNAQAFFGMGTLHGVEGNLEKAIQYLSDAIRISPGFVDAYYNLGVALERKKEHNKAIKMYKKALNLDKSHEKARSNLTHIQHRNTAQQAQ